MTTAQEPSFPLADLAARRFPLVARPQAIARPITTRVNQIQARADESATGGTNALLRAAETLNLAALLASDCGLPDLARSLCWRQFELFHAACPLPFATAKLALQPVINLARLKIRAGDGATAFTVLDGLFTAVSTRGQAEIDGQTVGFYRLTTDEDRAEIRAWLWEILLADGMRALARAGQWVQARTHAERLRGIGRRLRDGRQIAILAHCADDQPDAGLDLLNETDLAEPWETTVAACLAVICLHAAGCPTTTAARHMATTYGNLDNDPALVTFHARLGITILDLLNDQNPAATHIQKHILDLATGPGGGYAARDILAHTKTAAFLTEQQQAALTEAANAACPSTGTIPEELQTRLLNAVHTGETTIINELKIDNLYG